MKKLAALMIGMGLLLGTTAAVFAQDTKTGDTSKKKSSKKKKQETTKKDGGSSSH